MKLLKYSLIALISISLFSCEKDDDDSAQIAPATPTNEVTIDNSDDYELDLMISGDEEGATVKTQA